jgi:hypothetical protein
VSDELVEVGPLEFPDAQVIVIEPEDRLILLVGQDWPDDAFKALDENLVSMGLRERTLVVAADDLRLAVVRG